MSSDTPAAPDTLDSTPLGLPPREPEEQGGRSVRAVLRDARDYSIVRRSPYGLMPLLVMGGMSFFQRFDSAAFSVACSACSS